MLLQFYFIVRKEDIFIFPYDQYRKPTRQKEKNLVAAKSKTLVFENEINCGIDLKR